MMSHLSLMFLVIIVFVGGASNAPRDSHQTIVSLIASTTTRTGLIVKAALDTNHYETQIKVSDEQLARLRLKPPEFDGEWNYTILPHRTKVYPSNKSVPIEQKCKSYLCGGS